MMTQEIKTELFADYFQFFLQDESADLASAEPWTEESVERLLVVGPGIIGVGTARNMTVPVTVQFFDEEPEIIIDRDTIGQINECGLEVTSNKPVLFGCTDYFPDARRIEIETGFYKARLYYGNLDKLSEDGLDGDDYYEIHLWPTKEKADIKILKSKNAST